MRVTTHPSPATAPRGRVLTRAAVGTAALTAAALLMAASLAHAENTHVVALAQSVGAVLTNVRNWIMGLLASAATVFLTVGGVRYVLANGDPGEVDKAKQSFKSAGFGYALAALAPVVVSALKGIVGA